MTMMTKIPPKKALGAPFLVTAQGGKQMLTQINLKETGVYKEAWLQKLVHDHPEILPISEIEPGFGEPIAVGQEISCNHGRIDNLYVTPAGDIILVETKLWKNTEARREVVAQALDYVAAISRMDFPTFEAMVLKGSASPSLYALVADHHDALDESAFIDAIARNLKRGRMLILALGDGIRQEAESLADLVQNQMMAQFTFALVEIKLYKNSVTGDIITIPSTLMQTVMIERGILTMEAGMPVVKPLPPKQAASAKPKSITEDMFYEVIAAKDPTLPGQIKAFLTAVEPLGIYPEFKGSLNLKVDLPDAAKPLNVGYIQKNGQLRTNSVSWTAGDEIATAYAQKLADAIGGIVAKHDGIYVTTNGSSAPLISSIIPAHQDAWITAIEALIASAQAYVQLQV